MRVNFSGYLYMAHPGNDVAAKLDKKFKPLGDILSSRTMTKPLETGKTMVNGYEISNLANVKKAVGHLAELGIPFVYDPRSDFTKSREFAAELSNTGVLDKAPALCVSA